MSIIFIFGCSLFHVDSQLIDLPPLLIFVAHYERHRTSSNFKLVDVRWARPGSGFTLLFEAMIMVRFKANLIAQDGDPSTIEEMCCDISPAFISGVEKQFPEAYITCPDAAG